MVFILFYCLGVIIRIRAKNLQASVPVGGAENGDGKRIGWRR